MRRACSTRVTWPAITLERRRCLRSETAACRASTDPAITSGRNGWYVMYGRGSMTVISASSGRSFFSRFQAA